MNLKEFDKALACHDWYYAMSDDHSVWTRGEVAHGKLLKETKISIDHKALYDAYYNRHFTGKHYGTPEFTPEQLKAERERILGETK